MDEFSEQLNQHLDQLPPLLPPVDESNPLVMSVDESRQRLQKAAGDATEGDLPGALAELTGVNCHPDVGDQWDMLWLEVSALRFHLHDVYPLAVRCAAASLVISPRSEAASIRDELKAQHVWAWRFEGATPAVMMPGPAGVNSAGAMRPSLFTVQGYSNQGLPAGGGDLEYSLQHFYFAVFLNANQQYVASYVVQSYKLAGERVFCLQRQSGGNRDPLKLYDVPPNYQTAVADVIKNLEQSP